MTAGVTGGMEHSVWAGITSLTVGNAVRFRDTRWGGDGGSWRLHSSWEPVLGSRRPRSGRASAVVSASSVGHAAGGNVCGQGACGSGASGMNWHCRCCEFPRARRLPSS
jgi:hypothetical protein